MSWLSRLFRLIFDRSQPQPPPVNPPPQPPPTPDARLDALASAINAARRSRGLAPLARHGWLDAVAGDHAAENATTHRMTHAWLDGRSTFDHMASAGYRYSTAGECLAFGQRAPDQVVAAWASDPPHAAILLGRSYRDLGVGHAVASDGLDFWALVAAAPA